MSGGGGVAQLRSSFRESRPKASRHGLRLFAFDRHICGHTQRQRQRALTGCKPYFIYLVRIERLIKFKACRWFVVVRQFCSVVTRELSTHTGHSGVRRLSLYRTARTAQFVCAPRRPTARAPRAHRCAVAGAVVSLLCSWCAPRPAPVYGSTSIAYRAYRHTVRPYGP